MAFLRTHPALAAISVVISVVGAAAVFTGTVGALRAARHSTPPLAAPGRSAVPVLPDGAIGEPGNPFGTGAPSAASTPAPARSARPTSDGVAPRPSLPGPKRPQPARACRLSERLVPSCGVLWGVAPAAYTDLRPTQALATFEQKTGRPADIVHVYHRGDELFPTADEQAATRQGGERRLLLANWKVAWGSTFADVAAGRQDARIDRLAEHLKRTYRESFYLAVHHEPENDVNPDPASGMTARDYARMFRHTVERLRADGVTNVVTVMVYMAYEPWCVQPWFSDLWPGDDVVDWVGFDPYVFARPGGYGHGDFGYLVNRSSDPGRWPGFYSWVTRAHGNRPLMVAEWGVFEYPTEPARKAWIYSTVADQLRDYPAIRALVYFESAAAPKGDTRPDSSGPALAEYRRLAESSIFTVHLG